ncbi:hypothetical protein KAR34_11400, partial [bacterium]|nr:hypothetical protein [bacterium]
MNTNPVSTQARVGVQAHEDETKDFTLAIEAVFFIGWYYTNPLPGETSKSNPKKQHNRQVTQLRNMSVKREKPNPDKPEPK